MPNSKNVRRVNTELLCYANVNAIEQSMPAKPRPHRWLRKLGVHCAMIRLWQKESCALLNRQALSLLCGMPLDETLDDGEKIWDSFVLADEAIYIAHDLWHCPGIEDKGHMRLDCFQLLGECHARGSTQHVIRKNEVHWHSLHDCNSSRGSTCGEN